jgi:hypothetical protein
MQIVTRAAKPPTPVQPRSDMSLGICYVAYGQKYVHEVVDAMESHRFPATLFTDLTTPVPDDVFDQVIRDDFSRYAGLNGFYRKMIALERTPYDLSLYSDSEVKILGDIQIGFTRAARYGFATTLAPGQVFQWEGKDYVHYNGGLLFFRGRPTEFAAKVLELAQKFPGCDEPAWSVAFEELGINPALLPPIFNHVPKCVLHDRKIRAWHARCPVDRTHLTGSPDFS